MDTGKNWYHRHLLFTKEKGHLKCYLIAAKRLRFQAALQTTCSLFPVLHLSNMSQNAGYDASLPGHVTFWGALHSSHLGCGGRRKGCRWLREPPGSLESQPFHCNKVIRKTTTFPLPIKRHPWYPCKSEKVDTESVDAGGIPVDPSG